MAKSEYSVDRNTEDFDEIETNEAKDLEANTTLYDTAIGEMNTEIQSGITSAKDYAEEQKKIVEENLDFTLQQIEQNKQEAKEGLNKETSGAYTDYQKQTNKYGANAEAMAAQGLSGSGYAESARISMYNTYQNRVSSALDSYKRAITSYNNAITEARLQNSSLLAEIAYNALQSELSLTLQGLQYKNTLLVEKANRELQIKSLYESKKNTLWSQLMEELKLEKEVEYQNKVLNAQYGGLTVKDGEEDLPDLTDLTAPENAKDPAAASVFGPQTKGFGVDMDSILALGYGPLSVEEADKLVAEGKVKKYIKNGIVTYANNKDFTIDLMNAMADNLNKIIAEKNGIPEFAMSKENLYALQRGK